MRITTLVRTAVQAKPTHRSPSIDIFSLCCRLAVGVMISMTLATALHTPPAAAHYYPYRYASATAYLSDNGTDYPGSIQATVNDYHYNTEVTVGYGTGCPYYRICVVQNQYPYSTAAWAPGYRIEPGDITRTKHWCALDPDKGITGYCNNTNKRANGGGIFLNVSSRYLYTINHETWSVLKHEVGHIFGMGHPTRCDEVTIMRPVQCREGFGLLDNLVPHDKNNVNSYY